MPLHVRERKDVKIRKTLLSTPEFLSSNAILLYASFRSEVGTLELIDETLRIGKRVMLPRVESQISKLALFEIRSLSELSPGFMGISEPDLPDSRRRAVDDAGLVVIPGAVFDLSGNRLGYGAGYYDILLSGRAGKTPVAALAYEEQIVSLIPAEEHDVKVDIVITDARVIRVPRLSPG